MSTRLRHPASSWQGILPPLACTDTRKRAPGINNLTTLDCAHTSTNAHINHTPPTTRVGDNVVLFDKTVDGTVVRATSDFVTTTVLNATAFAGVAVDQAFAPAGGGEGRLWVYGAAMDNAWNGQVFYSDNGGTAWVSITGTLDTGCPSK